MTLNQLLAHEQNYDGYCTECRKVTVLGGVEPDGQGRKCDECGGHTVVGIGEAVVTNLITLEDD